MDNGEGPTPAGFFIDNSERKRPDMTELAYVNGQILPIEQAVVPIEDRGYNFGDAVYEFFASYRGRLFRVEEHLNRLERSLRELHFPPVSREEIRDAVLRLYEASGIERAGLYLQISRAVAPRDHAFPATGAPQVIMTVRPVHEKPPELRQSGAAVITVTDIRWARCDIKTVQLLPNVLAKQQAVEAGAFDALFVSEDEVVREGTSSNVFIVSAGRLLTHPLTPRILPGITRQVILDLCKKLALPAEERFFSRNDLYAADEAFLSGTVTEVLPITRVDGNSIGDGKVGPATQKLYSALREDAGAAEQAS
jgi:D-alanine transaminase